jgi:hypothetical protein
MSQTTMPEGANIVLEGPAKRRVAATREISVRAFIAWFFITFAASFGLVWIYVAALPMAFLDRDYPLWIAKRTMLDECRLGTVAIFGDSRALAANLPSVMPVPVSNFAMSGTSPIETYFAVRRALRCPTLPKIVVIAHSILKFSGDSDYWVFSARSGFLSYADMREVDRDAAQLHDRELELLRQSDQLPASLREFLFSVRFPAFYFDSLVNGVVAIRWHHNRNAFRDSLVSSGQAFFGTAHGSSGVAIEGRGPVYRTSPLVDFYFSQTLALLAKHGIPVYTVSMPVNRATYVRTDPGLKDGYEAYLFRKEREFPNLHIVGPAIPCWPNRFFGDAWHFNSAGATEYSHALGDWLVNALAGDMATTLPGRCNEEDADVSRTGSAFAAKQTDYGEK